MTLSKLIELNKKSNEECSCYLEYRACKLCLDAAFLGLTMMDDLLELVQHVEEFMKGDLYEEFPDFAYSLAKLRGEK